MEIRDAPKLVRVVRMDSVPLRKAYYTEEGYLRDRPILTSVGIFEYMNRDGTIRRELRMPEEVFDADSLASYLGAPIVITHDAGLIDKDNVAENQIGTILSKGLQDGDDVRADIIIHDTDELKHSKMKELSLGYNLDLEETPGTWQGEHYDAIQRNIRINHLAVVRDARAGEQARLNVDSREKKSGIQGGVKMSKEVKRARRLDSVLTDEQLDQAIAEFKRNHMAEGRTNSDEEVEENPAAEKFSGDKNVPTDDVEGRVSAVKERRDRRDEQGDPKDMDEAMGNIAHQDEDIQTLIDIIETLLAKGDYKPSAPAAEEVAEDAVDDLEKLKGDADDLEDEPLAEEDVDFGEDPDEDDGAFDGVDEEEPDVVDDTTEDEEDEYTEEEDEFTVDACDDPSAKNRMDAASIDRLVSQKIMLDSLGRSIGLKGLAHKSVQEAKKAIIHKMRPEMRLDGKSDVYINAAFDFAQKEIKDRRKKNTATQKRQMFNKDYSESRMDSNSGGSAAARERMIKRQHKANND